jgi:hypothetical protein
MPEGLEALAALFILLPGFMSARIAQIMSVRNKQSEFDRIVEALLFSFFTYVLYEFHFGPQIPLRWSTVSDKAGGPHYVFAVDHKKFFILIGIALVLGAVWGWIQGHDYPSKLLRAFRLTERSSRDSVWKDVFLSQKKGYVQVGLADGRSAIGVLANYSDSGKERAIFLTDASWVVESGDQDSLIPIPGAGLLLTDKSEIQFVMFLNK